MESVYAQMEPRLKINTYLIKTSATTLPTGLVADVRDSPFTLFIIAAPCGLPVNAQADLLNHQFPQSTTVGISGAAIFDEEHEIRDTQIWAIEFSHARLTHYSAIHDGDADIGRAIGVRLLTGSRPTGIMAFFTGALDGHAVLGGFREAVPAGIPLVGCASGRQEILQDSWIISDGGRIGRGAVAVPFFGDESFRFGHGWGSGWSAGQEVWCTECVRDQILLQEAKEPVMRPAPFALKRSKYNLHRQLQHPPASWPNRLLQGEIVIVNRVSL